MTPPLDDPFDMYRQLPSHQQRLAKEKEVNCYYVPGTDSSGALNYVYVVCSALLHDMFVESITKGAVPDYAVVVEMGSGEPTAEVKKKILDYYGFDHDAA